LLWKFRTQDEIVNSGRFAIDGEHVYLTSMDNMLYKIRLQDGFLIWKKKMASYGLCCSPTMGESDVFVPSDDGNVFRIDTGGNIKWKFSTTKPVGVVTVHHGKVYFTCEDKNMYCINAETGKLVWNFRTQELNWWGVAAEDKRIYFCSYDCHVYALDSEAGGLIWKFRTDGSPSYIPPHNDMYEFVIKVPESEINENKEKRYDIKISSEEDGDVNFYKSRLTYQVSTQYAAKGKYQIDSDEEEF